MEAFLGAILTKVVMAVLGAALGWFAKIWHQKMQDKAADAKAVEEHQPLKDAQTGDEIDKASDPALNHL